MTWVISPFPLAKVLGSGSSTFASSAVIEAKVQVSKFKVSAIEFLLIRMRRKYRVTEELSVKEEFRVGLINHENGVSLRTPCLQITPQLLLKFVDLKCSYRSHVFL